MRANLMTTTLVAGYLFAVGGCATIPEDALVLSPDSMERRQLQTRRIDGIGEKELLCASAGASGPIQYRRESETRRDRCVEGTGLP
jgi:hypothetical protein